MTVYGTQYSKFIGYRVAPVFFGGYRPYRAYACPEEFDNLEDARVFAIKVINRNKDIYTKGFIEEWFQSCYKGFEVEKVYVEVKKGKRSYWMTKIDDRKHVYQISSVTGKIIRTELKKKA